MIHVAFIITGLSTGGAERMLLKVLEHIDRTRFSPYVISLTTMGKIGLCIKGLDIPVEALHMASGRFHPAEFFKIVSRLRSLRPDIVHTWMYHADLLGGAAARLAGIRSICWSIRNCDLSPEHSSFSTRLVMRTCAVLSRWLPLKILCCSHVAMSVHVAAGYDESKMVVIPNGFNLSLFQRDIEARGSVRAELKLGAETPIVGLIGRYDPQKNHKGFFEAAAFIHKHRPDVHFLLAGTGVDKLNSELRGIAELAGVSGQTHVLGNREDMPRLMAALDILASSSYSEAFPNVLGEAMACGVVCVVTDVGDSAVIVNDTGKVVSSGDMRNLAIEILGLLSLPTDDLQKMGEKTRARVREHYEIGAIVKKYEMFYENLGRRTTLCVD